tara:strand:- start:1770 stop:2645 length:876 start_codon:yes stop_codon:yes gene_type:complete
LSQASGISLGTVNTYERLKRSPLDAHGDWLPSARKLSDFHGLSPDELWPAELLEDVGLSLPVVRWDESDNREEYGEWWNNPNPDLRPDLLLLKKEFLEIVNEGLQWLPDNEREVLELRFGLGACDRQWSIAEIGDYFDVNPNRIRQRLNGALLKLGKLDSEGRRTWVVKNGRGEWHYDYDDHSLWPAWREALQGLPITVNPERGLIAHRWWEIEIACLWRRFDQEEAARVNREKRKKRSAEKRRLNLEWKKAKQKEQERTGLATRRSEEWKKAFSVRFAVPTFGMYENFGE